MTEGLFPWMHQNTLRLWLTGPPRTRQMVMEAGCQKSNVGEPAVNQLIRDGTSGVLVFRACVGRARIHNAYISSESVAGFLDPMLSVSAL